MTNTCNTMGVGQGMNKNTHIPTRWERIVGIRKRSLEHMLKTYKEQAAQQPNAVAHGAYSFVLKRDFLARDLEVARKGKPSLPIDTSIENPPQYDRVNAEFTDEFSLRKLHKLRKVNKDYYVYNGRDEENWRRVQDEMQGLDTDRGGNEFTYSRYDGDVVDDAMKYETWTPHTIQGKLTGVNAGETCNPHYKYGLHIKEVCNE